MKIAVILNAHGNTELVADTVDSIRMWVTDRILLLVDGASWNTWGRDAQLPVHKVQGLWHNCPRSPYRNITLALYNALMAWDDIDWFCYTEYDVLFGSEAFKDHLAEASKSKIYCLGNDYRTDNMKFPFLEHIVKSELHLSHYLLGCCVFHKAEYLHKLNDIGFFQDLLHRTNGFSDGYFPQYEEQGGYDFGEHLYPTLAVHLGGEIRQFAKWSRELEQWSGDYEKFPMRWQPEIDPQTENFWGASIIHPLKTLDHPIRVGHRSRRQQARSFSYAK